MSPNDAGDVPSSPESDTEQESSIMAEEKYNRASTDEKSPDRASNGNKPAKSNAKDPSRPRRKKARRACFACQRAHLTCGDERPCNRCIKRGLQDQCHDGVRKKAKYLHDAPPEALLPGYQSTYTINGGQTMPTGSAPSMSSGNMSAPQASNYYPSAPSFPQYGPVGQPNHLGHQDHTSRTGNAHQPPAMSSPMQYQQQQPNSQQVSPAHDLSNTVDQPSAIGNISNPSFEASLFDPADPGMFFNLADMNFGNHYGALEFGMLGHMTSGAVNTPDVDVLDSMNSSGSFSYDGTGGFPISSFPYTQGYQPWQTSGSRQGSTTNLWALHHNGMDAYAVADTTGSFTDTSPQSQSQDWNMDYTSSNVSPQTQFVQPDHQRQHESQRHRHRQSAPFPDDFGPMMSKKARRNTKHIYASVTKPYPYTQRFHSLFAFMYKRFSSESRIRVAEALSLIRPSFISATKDLSEDDLIFMEQGFQRQLVDYDDTWQQTGTPSIICRRTGEVVSCNKEFSLVTGWQRDVLLGKAPNLNVNFGSSTGTHTGSSTRGAVTPDTESEATLPEPVFIAELMDQDDVAGFWEDFAARAFGASTSSMAGVTCSLMKYKTKNDPGWGPEDRLGDGNRRSMKTEREKGGSGALGERDGKLDMSMTWLVRRDMFDIPMMIVINVSCANNPPFGWAGADLLQFLPMI
ncbi:Transcriptional regulator of nonfermentable carbon utilization [Saxophila tyrrhenica]|uniref:Transcriptional regulator of nonfermentable carbon utilization n=1 Tax=Saxophila tyrrhenica TaxID=1690608 RepID=A0AAV9NVT0_9PEZI|nr:Transcriptional regulator of nonfermentable carbon utilization [Saxophila tyrrhenica]